MSNQTKQMTAKVRIKFQDLHANICGTSVELKAAEITGGPPRVLMSSALHVIIFRSPANFTSKAVQEVPANCKIFVPTTHILVLYTIFIISIEFHVI